MSWFLTILGIVALIVLHELGHFSVAKAVGMRVERFSLFFPPTIARIRRGETEYAIGALPAGGYVKITGMNPEEVKDLPAEVRPRAYYSQPPWKRIAVILAGPLVNIAIAFVLFAVVLWGGSYGGALTLGNLDPSIESVISTTKVAGIQRGMPAQHALRPGDEILTVEGRKATAAAVVQAVQTHRCAGPQVQGCVATTPVRLTVKRDGRVVPVAVRPKYDSDYKRMLIGFDFGAAPRSFGLLGAAGASATAMWHATGETVAGLGRALTSSKERSQIHSIVGITEVTDEAVQAGAGKALVVLGYVSLVLGVINLFPFLPLDGGHILWALAEKVRGRRVSVAAMWRFSSVGLVLLAFLVISGISNDIGRIAG
jgi:regulator of sigma E protease